MDLPAVARQPPRGDARESSRRFEERAQCQSIAWTSQPSVTFHHGKRPCDGPPATRTRTRAALLTRYRTARIIIPKHGNVYT